MITEQIPDGLSVTEKRRLILERLGDTILIGAFVGAVATGLVIYPTTDLPLMTVVIACVGGWLFGSFLGLYMRFVNARAEYDESEADLVEARDTVPSPKLVALLGFVIVIIAAAYCYLKLQDTPGTSTVGSFSNQMIEGSADLGVVEEYLQDFEVVRARVSEGGERSTAPSLTIPDMESMSVVRVQVWEIWIDQNLHRSEWATEIPVRYHRRNDGRYTFAVGPSKELTHGGDNELVTVMRQYEEMASRDLKFVADNSSYHIPVENPDVRDMLDASVSAIWYDLIGTRAKLMEGEGFHCSRLPEGTQTERVGDENGCLAIAPLEPCPRHPANECVRVDEILVIQAPFVCDAVLRDSEAERFETCTLHSMKSAWFDSETNLPTYSRSRELTQYRVSSDSEEAVVARRMLNRTENIYRTEDTMPTAEENDFASR